MDELIRELKNLEISVAQDVPGATLTTYRVGGQIAYVVSLCSIDDVAAVGNLISKNFYGQLNENNVVTIGNGSNVLVDDDGFNGIVFHLDGELGTFSRIPRENENVSVGGGVSLPTFARQCASMGVAGLEFYVGIPGTIGGAVAMNAGGHGKQTSDVLIACDVLDLATGTIERYVRDSCHFSYRHSRFAPTDIIFSATYETERGNPDEIKSVLDSIVQWRREHQPGGRNVGSVFQNPSDIPAAQLIEECGLKGFSIGGAHVSEKHANFIQADDSASARDIKELIEYVRRTVSESTGHRLETEVRYITS